MVFVKLTVGIDQINREIPWPTPSLPAFASMMHDGGAENWLLLEGDYWGLGNEHIATYHVALIKITAKKLKDFNEVAGRKVYKRD